MPQLVVPSTGSSARLLLDPPQSGPRNMAVDQAILESMPDTQRGCLRFYQWEPATVSLGYFQVLADRQLHPPSRECPLVRRATGGGAIVHDRELTYSFCLPSQHRFSEHNRELYDVVHQALLATLAAVGAPGAALWAAKSTAAVAAEPFLCFQRRSPGDVVLDGYKICGSAQRRVDGAILQHGSLLLQKSDAAPELPGVAELSGRPPSLEEIREIWTWHLARTLGFSFETSGLSNTETAAATVIQRDRFAHPAWTARR